MKKYKLIKEYPNSPRLNSILIGRGQNSYYTVNSKTIYYSLCPHLYPEFWEEVVEKNYEILSILLKRSDEHYVRNLDTRDSDNYITSLIKCDGNSIHSVKKLSDGKIFTIGDAITNKSPNVNWINCFITGFELTERGLKVRNSSKGSHPFEDIKHAKRVLFVTEDGEEICIGDDYWVYDETMMTYKIHKVFKASITHTGDGVGRKYFHKEDNARDYRILNLPLLSINDIVNSTQVDEGDTNWYNLKDLIKNKLNG